MVEYEMCKRLYLNIHHKYVSRNGLHIANSTMKLFHHTTFSKCVTTRPCSLKIITTEVRCNTIAMGTTAGRIRLP